MIISLISCTKKKKNYTCPANELYSESTLFKYAYAYSKIISEKTFILSAKYGLIEENEIIDNYDLTLNNQSIDYIKDWSNKVFNQLSQKVCFDNLEIVFLAGNNYRKYLIPLLKNCPNIKISVPLKNLGIGKQLQFLKLKVDKS